MKTTKYVCQNCKRGFETPGVAYDSHKTSMPRAYEEYAVCPHCGSTAFEDAPETPTKRELRQYSMLKREIEAERLRLSDMDEKDEDYAVLYEMIENNKMRCTVLMIKLQEFIYSIDDSLLRQIFTLRYVDGLSWDSVAAKTGGYYSADYLRIMHDRYLKRQ
ncbi:MAG: hypothetical protein IJ408_02365 [Clostridia bacterium]|nr:hypothetical protein [Clostridia bacterium]